MGGAAIITGMCAYHGTQSNLPWFLLNQFSNSNLNRTIPARVQIIPVSDALLQEKALEIAAELLRKIGVAPADGDFDEEKAKSAQLITELTDFKASKGWLDRWKQRFNVARITSTSLHLVCARDIFISLNL